MKAYIYVIDAYNLLFQIKKASKFSENQKNDFIDLINECMSFLGLKGILIFDSNPNHARNYPTKKKLSQVEVAYSPIDMEADLYILEYLSLLKTPSRIRLVTSDRALAKEAKNLKIESIDSLDFFNLLKKAGTKKEAINKDLKPTSESKKELERLQKIFESNN
ncbi:MAG: hypothetical protein FJZ59_04575 [Chlamydiae bacterium]|nr:hypothetical protein [Chlamydiota bacterium]